MFYKRLVALGVSMTPPPGSAANRTSTPPLRRWWQGRFGGFGEREVESAQTRENWELMLRLHLFWCSVMFRGRDSSKSDVEAWLGEEAKKGEESIHR